MAKRATRVEWHPEQGHLILHGEEEGAAPVALSLPLSTLRTLSAYSRRYVPADADRPLGAWPNTEPVTVGKFEVTVLPTAVGERVLFVVDRGLDTEMGFSFRPEQAREVARALRDTATRARGGTPRRS
jgi:hypothetical protein